MPWLLSLSFMFSEFIHVAAGVVPLLWLFSRSVVSDSLRPHRLQHARLPVLHHLPEFAQTHVHWVNDAIQPSHPLSSPSPPAHDLSQHQSLFQWVGSSHQVVKVLEIYGVEFLHRVLKIFFKFNVPLYGYTTFCLSVHALMDILVSAPWLSWLVLLWTTMYKYLFKYLFKYQFFWVCAYEWNYWIIW